MLGCKTIWKAMQHVILAGISAGDALQQGHQPVITRERKLTDGQYLPAAFRCQFR